MNTHIYDVKYLPIQTNTFQCVLATNGFESFVMFLYPDGRIQWTTGDDSGGSGGLGGIEALAGINAGDGENFILIPESRTRSIINIAHTSNVGNPGVWIFRVDHGGKYSICIRCMCYVIVIP